MAKAPIVPIIAGKNSPAILEWVTIRGEGKENMSGKMQYVANAVFKQDDPEFIRLKTDIEAYWKANKPSELKKAMPKSNGIYFRDNVLDEAGEKTYNEDGKVIKDKTGLVYLAFKTGTTWPDGKTKVVTVHNIKNGLIDLGDRSIGNGSIGAIQGKMGIYENRTPQGVLTDAGVTLYLDKIQLRKYVEHTGEDAAFDVVEDDGESFMGFEDEDVFGEATKEEAESASTGEAKQARL
jgi:hypothetical protein